MLTKKELLIVANLRRNARESLTRMSRKTAIPVSTIYDKIKVYEQTFMKRSTCLLDFDQLGYHTRATIMLKINKEHREQVKQDLLKSKAVNSVYKVANDYDYLVEGVFRQVADVQLFLDALEKEHEIEAKKVFYIVEDVRKEEFLSNPEYIRLTGGIE